MAAILQIPAQAAKTRAWMPLMRKEVGEDCLHGIMCVREAKTSPITLCHISSRPLCLENKLIESLVLCVQSCLTLWLTRLLCPWSHSGKNHEAGSRFLLQGIFPTWGSNPRLLCLLHWQVDSSPLGKSLFQSFGTLLQCIFWYRRSDQTWILHV